MGQNIYEKILSRVSGRKGFGPKDILWLHPDLITCMDFLSSTTRKTLEEFGVQKLRNPEKVVAVVDHCTEQSSVPAGAEMVKAFREWAERNGVTSFYDSGRGGLQAQVIAEKGHVRPGMMVVSDDPSVEMCGALGAFVKGGEDVATALAIDEFWFEVPEIVKCHVKGSFPRGTLSIDLRYKLNGDFGESFGKFVEFTGPTIDAMGMDARFNLCSSLYLSGSYGIVAADETSVEYVKSRTQAPFDIVRSDPDAQYAGVYEYDVSDLAPQIAFPPSSCDTRPVTEAEGIHINEACIGACSSGRLADLRVAAEILRGRKVHPKVRMYITPASQEVYLRAINEGLIAVFVEAGALVPIPSCGTCPGHIGRLAAGEVCITTSTVNVPGRMGSKEAEIYLASAATAAASAMEGRISDPRKYLR
jgi:3-isopropylmalate/(R)-2-methylmalate dehydratase large subunit